jgi:hypothetical protein
MKSTPDKPLATILLIALHPPPPTPTTQILGANSCKLGDDKFFKCGGIAKFGAVYVVPIIGLVSIFFSLIFPIIGACTTDGAEVEIFSSLKGAGLTDRKNAFCNDCPSEKLRTLPKLRRLFEIVCITR